MEDLEVTTMFGDTFKNRSVFVTGHTGFKGSWLALWLHRLGANVTGYSLPPPTEPSNYVASGVKEILEADHEGDIRDASKLHPALKANEPAIVFHLAAQSLVRLSYATPRETFSVNVDGTACLLDGVRALVRPCVVLIVTSDKCYENVGQVRGYRETDSLGGHDAYSASKAAAEILVAAYRRSFFPPPLIAKHGVKVASVRAGNVIGGGDWAVDRIVPDMVKSLSAGKAVPVRNPKAIRPWQHVLEPLGGYLTLAARMLGSEDPKWCGAWNFGPSESEQVTVAGLVERFCHVWGGGAWKDCSDPTAPHEAGLLRLSIEKANCELGWCPRWSTSMTIEQTASWYREFYAAKKSMRERCLDDIEAYEKASGDV